MSLADAPLLSFDVESTGTDVFTDRIVSATVVRIEPGVEPKVRTTVIDPGVEVPDAAAGVHGFTTARVRAGGKPPALELEWIAADLTDAWKSGTAVVIANAPFDLTMLNAELCRHNLPTLEGRMVGRPIGPVIDPMCIDRTLDRFRKGKRTLTDLCQTYNCRIDGAHDATFDAIAAARVAWQLFRLAEQALEDPSAVKDRFSDRPKQADRIVRGFQGLGRASLGELHDAQVGWYRAKAIDFAQYVRKTANQAEHDAEQAEDPAERETLLADVVSLRAKADDVSTDWPLRPFGGKP